MRADKRNRFVWNILVLTYLRCLINKGLKIMASGAGGRKRMFIPPKDEIGLDMEQRGTPSTPDGKKKVKKVSNYNTPILWYFVRCSN